MLNKKRTAKIQILPKFLKPALWSYDISKMRLDNPSDKKEIITQVLNCGTDEQIEWLFKTYQSKEIRQVLKEPRRGTWYSKSLNFWTKILGIKISEKKFKKSLAHQEAICIKEDYRCFPLPEKFRFHKVEFIA